MWKINLFRSGSGSILSFSVENVFLKLAEEHAGFLPRVLWPLSWICFVFFHFTREHDPPVDNLLQCLQHYEVFYKHFMKILSEMKEYMKKKQNFLQRLTFTLIILVSNSLSSNSLVAIFFLSVFCSQQTNSLQMSIPQTYILCCKC